MAGDELARFKQRLDRYDQQRTGIRNGLLALILRFFTQMKNPYSPVEVAEYSKQVADATRRAQLAQINLAVAQQRILLADQNVTLPKFTAVLPAQPRGVDPVDVAQRAAREVRLAEAALKGQAKARAVETAVAEATARRDARQAEAKQAADERAAERADAKARRAAAAEEQQRRDEEELQAAREAADARRAQRAADRLAASQRQAREAEADAERRATAAEARERARQEADRKAQADRDAETARQVADLDAELIEQELAEARRRGLERALVAAAADVQLAEREGVRQALEKAPANVTGYRRVIHPELSSSGVCGLCIAAADREYKKAELLPIHDRCVCSVSPVIDGEVDFGDALNAEDITELYKRVLAEAKPHTTREVKDADGKVIKKSTTSTKTGRESLSKVRFKVDEHGELGPYLRPHSKGADDPAVEIVADSTDLPTSS